MPNYDYIVIGSGIAGLYTALLAQEHGSVLILTKGSIDECNTKYAQGGIAAAIGPDDSPELHLRDTLEAGAGLCDPEAVRILVEEAPDRITDLIKFGVPFDTLGGEIAFTKEAAHSVSRVIHAGGDATGRHIELTLANLAHLSKITVLEHSLVTEILVERGTARGVNVLDCRSNTSAQFECRFLIVATGGAGQLFRFSTNPVIATGDGVALAYHAGADIVDMEFYQFHPTGLRLPGVAPFLISESVRGEGGVLRNKYGKAFMTDYSTQGDLAPRDVVARGIRAEMQKTGSDSVLLDITHLPVKKISARFPNIYRFCLEQGLDITTTCIPVAPAAHYMMGGIRTNTWGETNIKGLFACGEAACTGVHGANRLASNSLLETLIFSKRVVQRTRERKPSPYLKNQGNIRIALQTPTTSTVNCPCNLPSLPALQSLMWDKVGIIRSGQSLQEARDTLARWEMALGSAHDRASHELSSMIVVGRLMTEAALLREESRGAHFRTDFPKPSRKWERHIIISAGRP